MSLEIKVGPPQLAIHQGHAVLLSELNGQINWPSEKGLYFYDARVIISWTVYANGEPWDLLNGGTTTSLAARVFLTNRALITERGPIDKHTLGLVLSRHIDGAVHEDLDVTNYARTEVRFNLEIALRCDFADLFEVKSDHFVLPRDGLVRVDVGTVLHLLLRDRDRQHFSGPVRMIDCER